MTLSRRKAMSIALGGAIAGPSVAKDAIQQVGKQNLLYKGMEVGFDKAFDSGYLKEKLIEEKDYLIKIITGEIDNPDTDRNGRKREILQRNIESLKSVTKSNKLIFYMREVDKRCAQEQIEDAKRRLPELLKQLAGL